MAASRRTRSGASLRLTALGLARRLRASREADDDGSHTAQRVAALRAGLPRPHTPDGDPDAQRRMCRGMRPPRSARLRHHVLARTRFVDRAVLDALADGIVQVLIVGAGYDDRALRFRTPGVRFFEIDQPATQADKRRRLAAISAHTEQLTLVAADVRTPDLARALHDAGHDAQRPSLFVCEGLLLYLRRGEIVRLLATLAGRAGAGSVLAASLVVHPDGYDSTQVVARANARRPGPGGEPWLTILPLSEHLGLLREAGWREEQVVDESDRVPPASTGGSVFVRASLRRQDTP